MNALWMPWNLIYITMYEGSKREIYKWQLEKSLSPLSCSDDNSDKNSNDSLLPSTQGRYTAINHALPAWSFPLCSSTSASIAAIATHPIDVVKTRLQVLTAAEHGHTRRTAMSVASELWAAEGVSGFVRGMSARVATLSMGSSVSWFVYEMVKRQLASHDAN